MIEVLGWFSTALVLGGYIFNARLNTTTAFILWILGDIGWIIYDCYIDNFSHLVLSAVIIGINVYGMFNHSNGKTKV